MFPAFVEAISRGRSVRGRTQLPILGRPGVRGAVAPTGERKGTWIDHGDCSPKGAFDARRNRLSDRTAGYRRIAICWTDWSYNASQRWRPHGPDFWRKHRGPFAKHAAQPSKRPLRYERK